MAAMARSLAAWLLIFAGVQSTAAATVRVDVTPLQQVVKMLDDMLAKGKQEKHNEEVEFAKYHEWCDQVRDEKTKSIKEAAEKIDQLTAAIDKAESDAQVLSQEIKDLEAEIASLTEQAKNATAVRDAEHADFTATHEDLKESLDAIARALEVLKARTADVPQELLQVKALPMLPVHAKAVIQSFIELGKSPGDDDESSPPEANAYEFQSGGVVALLQKLRLKFQDQKLDLEKQEMNAKHNYEVLMQQLTDDITYNEKSAKEKTAMKAKRLEDAATAKGELEITETGKAEDEKMLEDTTAECHSESGDYERNQVVRAAEIKAIEEAIKILNSDAVKGNAETYLPAASLAQTQAAFAQLRAATANASPEVRRKVAEFLQGRAAKLNSKYLALVASRAEADPFAKVKKLIKDLIVKLMEQANEEADEHAWCQTELATNKQTREIKSEEVEQITAELEKQTAELQKTTDEIAALTDEIAAIRGQQAEATKIREEEKAANTKTIADAKVAQEAVEKATQVLKEFYTSAGGIVFLQAQGSSLRADMEQAASLDPYKGMQDLKGGVMGFLEVVLSDFARLEAQTATAEDNAQTQYDKFIDESNEDLAVKGTEVKHLEDRKAQLEENIAELKKNLALTQTELDKANTYFDKLKKRCVDTGLNYADRKKMREEEIESLKQALLVLDGQEIAL